MSKLFFINNGVITSLAALSLIMTANTASAKIPGEYLTADLGQADLMATVLKHPTTFSVALIIFVGVCVGWGIYYLIKIIRKK